MTKTDYRAEADKYLNVLKNKGLNRAQIESELGYANNYIDQQLSKGGNKRFVKALRDLVDKLQKAIPDKSDQFLIEEDIPEYGLTFKSIMNQQNKLIISLNKQSETANEILRRLADNVEKRVDKIDVNLIDALGRMDSLKMDIYSERMVVLQSLARLEKKPENSLLSEADNIISSMLEQQQKKQGNTPGKSM
jgi:hypothetical protein